MPKYKINYYFDGKGSTIINASTPEEAEKLYHDGMWEDDRDDSENYCIDTIEELKNS